MCYFIEVSFPIKVSERDSAWVKVNALRSPSQSGYHNGKDRVEMDGQMAEECANAINTMANKLKDKRLLTSPQQTQEASNTTHYETGQSSLDGQQSTNTSETRGGSGNREMYPPSEAQTQYLDLLRMKGTKHHDRTVSFLSEHNKISIGELDKRQTSDLISILKDIKE